MKYCYLCTKHGSLQKINAKLIKTYKYTCNVFKTFVSV